MGDEETIEDIEETPEEEESFEGVGPRKKMFGPTVVRTLIFIALALVLIVISGTIAYLVSKRAGAPPATEKTSPEFVEKEDPLSYYPLESFSINTSDTDEPHFVKITLSLGYEMGKVEIQTELVQRRDQLRDIIISIIGAKRYTDLNTQDKREELKTDIQRRINGILQKGKIKGIAITEFVLT
jgi:flagellar FliL protein